MSTVEHTPLGGFEERLLAQLKTHVATQPTPDCRLQQQTATRGHRVRTPRTRSIMTSTAAASATLVAVLNLLPGGGQTALAAAFPILRQRPQQLPARLERILRTERLPAGTSPTDQKLAYAFPAPTGTGYVVVDQQHKWICLVVPGFGEGNRNVLCETAWRLLTETRRGLQLTRKRNGNDEIVALLPRGSTATLISTQSSHSIALHRGILTIVTHHPVSITTTIRGHATTTTYDLTGKTSA